MCDSPTTVPGQRVEDSELNGDRSCETHAGPPQPSIDVAVCPTTSSKVANPILGTSIDESLVGRVTHTYLSKHSRTLPSLSKVRTKIQYALFSKW